MRQISAKLMGLSSNSRVTEKIEEQVNLACSAQIWQVKKEVGLSLHYTKDQHSNPHHFFFIFFSYTAALLCIPTIWLEALKTSRRGFLFISSCNYCAERLCCSCTLIQILLIRVLVIKHLNRRFGCETIHPTQKILQ